MRIIISPAKKMRSDPDCMDALTLPEFLPQTEKLLMRLQGMSSGERRALWKCNEKIALLNDERLEGMDLFRNLTPAVLAYEGIQYQYMAPHAFTNDEFAYVQEHLRILSGFYGMLRPFDGVTPYRLEMQARLPVGEAGNLYDFWGEMLAEKLFSETDCVIDLASKEYSMCISRHLPPDKRIISCVFAERQHGKLIEKGTMCKMARGEMVRFMAENQVKKPEEIQAFQRQDYRYSPEYSEENRFVFLRC